MIESGVRAHRRSAPVTAPSSGGEWPGTATLRVLAGFELECGGDCVAVPPNVERVLAFLAIRGRPQARSTVASALWMDSPRERAAANLRTALWKARNILGDGIECPSNHLRLASWVTVDLHRLLTWSRVLAEREDCVDDVRDELEVLDGDLLPDWDEEWVMFERERVRQLRIHALEALCRRLVEAGRPAEAIDAGLAAVAAEPLRESAQRVLIEAHLSEHNACEARAQYERYRGALWEALAIEPSSALRATVGLPTNRH